MGITGSRQEDHSVSRVDHNTVSNGDNQLNLTHFVLTIVTLIVVLCGCVIVAVKFFVKKCTRVIVAEIKRETMAATPSIV